MLISITPLFSKFSPKLIITTLVALLVLCLVSVVTACSTPTPTPAPAPAPETSMRPTPSTTPTPNLRPKGRIKALWIDPEITGETISIPVNEVLNNWNTHFPLGTQSNEMNFMAYTLDGEIYVRANVCPPCRSVGFSLEKDILVCDRCNTTFEAESGDGIKGACVDYPKAAVPFELVNGKIFMREADLVAAYEDTIKPGDNLDDSISSKSIDISDLMSNSDLYKGRELPPSSYLPEVPRLSIEEVKAKLDAGSNIIIIDTRSKTEYDRSHIVGAFLETLLLNKPHDDFSVYDEVIFYCT